LNATCSRTQVKPVRPEKPATSRSPDPRGASDAVKRVARVYERRSAKRGKVIMSDEREQMIPGDEASAENWPIRITPISVW
jgi:hypothetical protein